GGERRLLRHDLGPGAARRDAVAGGDLRSGGPLRLARAGEGGERGRLVGRPVRVHDGCGARADSGQGDPAQEPADGAAGEVQEIAAYLLGRQRAAEGGTDPTRPAPYRELLGRAAK